MVNVLKGVLIECDPVVKQFLLHMDDKNILGHKFILEDLDETHLFVSADIVPVLKEKVSGARTSSMSPYLNIDPSYLNQGGAEFVFPTDSKKKRGWGERMFSSIGTSYMFGLTIGGSYGLYEGLKNPDGKTFKLRLNSVLNGCTRRGPFLANSLGIVALMYCSLDSLIGKVRGEEDQFNSIAAATGTGMIFKSTAGLRPIAIAGAIGGSLAVAYHFGEKLLEGKGQTMSTPNWA